MALQKTIFALSIACFLVIGCAANKIPPEIIGKITYGGPFSNIRANPAGYVGRYVVLGGKIIGTENLADRSELLVLQLPLDINYKPNSEKISEGRFLVKSATLLDPAVYSPDLLVSVAGEITEVVIRPVGAYQYRYPVLKPDRIWTWDPRIETTPQLHFGIGVGAAF